jgi:hypothetical protein
MALPCTPKSLFTTLLVNSVKWKVVVGKVGWERVGWLSRGGWDSSLKCMGGSGIFILGIHGSYIF